MEIIEILNTVLQLLRAATLLQADKEEVAVGIKAKLVHGVNGRKVVQDKVEDGCTC